MLILQSYLISPSANRIIFRFDDFDLAGPTFSSLLLIFSFMVCLIFQSIFQDREKYVVHIQEFLEKNLQTCSIIDPPVRDLKIGDMFHAAIELEYEVFSKNTVIITYRNAIVKLVSIHFLLFHF